MYEYVLSTLLISFSIFTGFLLVGYIRPTDVDEEQGKKFDEHTNQILYEYILFEELDNEPESELNEEQLNDLKNNVLKMEILYINQPIIMYYDNTNKSFSYYSNTDILYKYLDIAARRYVLDYNCKQIYNKIKESEIDTKHEAQYQNISDASKLLNDLFIKQQKQNTKKIIEKKMNKFIRIGSIYEYEYETVKQPLLEPIKNVNILDYLKFFKRD
jgi:hypothetical protein